MKWLGGSSIGVGIVVVLAYVAVLGALYFLQRDFQYDRGGRMFALSETQADAGRSWSASRAPTARPSPAGTQPPAAGKPLILYFRGNAQSFSREHERYEAFVADGYGFLAFDYRGFPGSPGEVTEENILADGLAAYRLGSRPRAFRSCSGAARSARGRRPMWRASARPMRCCSRRRSTRPCRWPPIAMASCRSGC